MSYRIPISHGLPRLSILIGQDKLVSMNLGDAGITVSMRVLLICLLSSHAFAGNTPQTIAFRLTTDTHTLTALASSGLGVSFASTTPDVCSVRYTYLFDGVMPRYPFWAFQLVGLGTCSVTALQDGDSTYAAAAPVTQTLSIPARLPQVIQFPAIEDINFGQGYVGLNASATSGLPVSYASLTPAVCGIGGYSDGSAGISALIAGPVAPGVCSVAATQSGNAAWLAAPTVTQSFTIKPVTGISQTITFLPIGNVTFGQTTIIPLSATASSGLPVTFASSSPGVCSVSGASATILSVGECYVTASQPGNASYNAALQAEQFFNVAPAHATDVNINYLRSATGGGGGYSPGSLFSIYGSFMASGTMNVTAPLPLSSNGTVVTFNGIPCPLLYVSATQINAQVPAEAVPGPAGVVVSYNGTSAGATMYVSATSPDFFTDNALAIAQHADYSVVTFANPARTGEIVMFYGTGIGPISPAVASGQLAPSSSNLAVSTATYSATVAGTDAPVSFLGLTPTLAGVMQLNLQIPAAIPSGLLLMVLTIDGSSAGVTIPVIGQ
jgi:uncharacterized protein (TIGR03437 family)